VPNLATLINADVIVSWLDVVGIDYP